MRKRHVVKKVANSKGTVFALVTDGVTFEVWKECENYDRRAPGGIAKTWRYVAVGLEKSAAESLFERRTK